MTGSLDLINDVLLVGLKIAALSCIARSLVDHSRDSSARVLHQTLLLALLGCLLIPILSYILPVIAVPILPGFVVKAAQFEWPGVTGAAQHPELALLITLYLLVALSLLVKLGANLWWLRTLRSNATPIPQHTLPENVTDLLSARAAVELLASPTLGSPVSWGLARPKIALPDSYHLWSATRLHHVVLHELAHIQRRDWPVTVLGHVAVAVLWPLPGVRALREKLSWYAEVACDDQVLSNGISRTDYANSLLSFAGVKSEPLPGNYLIDPSVVFQRIHTVLDGARVYQSGSRPVLCLACLGLAFLLPASALELTPIRVQPTESFQLFSLHSAAPAKPEQLSRENEPAENLDWQALRVHLVSTDAQSPALPGFEWALDTELSPQQPVVRNTIWQPSSRLTLSLPQHSVVRPKPVYPRRALISGQEGEVVVEFEVTANGTVTNEKIVSATPGGVFEVATLDALRQSRFSPRFAKPDGQAAQQRREIFRFLLNEDANPNHSPANKVVSSSR